MTDNKDKKALNVPDKRVQNDACISSAEREEQVTKARPKGNVPALRFPEFTEEWKSVHLEDVAEFQKKRISSDLLNNNNYISTENILQNFEGIQYSSSIPANTNVIEYQKGDILLSNIRPYLKKVWFSDRKGGCSADVFVLRGDKCDQHFLYYVIASDRFINYVMSGVKGVKMPRGDKSQMVKYAFSIPTNTEQRKIAKFLSMLDERIKLQNKIIEKLETLIKGIVEKTFVSSQYVTLQHYSPIITSGKDQNSGGNYPLYGSTGVIGSVLNPSYNKPIVLIARVGSIGNVQYVTAPCGISDNTLIIDAGEDNRFIYYYLNGYNFSHIISGTTQPLITASSVKKIEIPVIEKHRRKKIVSTLYAIEQKLRNEKYIAYLLSRQKYFLLSQMFI